MDIFTAARSGDVETLKKIIAAKSDVNIKNERGHSPLMLSAYNGHFTASELLIQNGAEVNSVDESGNSIIMGVVFKGHSAVFELLIKAGADLTCVNKKNQTTLDIAVMFGRRSLIFRINQLQKTQRSDGRGEQLKTWARQLL